MLNNEDLNYLTKELTANINNTLRFKTKSSIINNYLILIAYGMIIKYGRDKIKDICNTINEIDYIIDCNVFESSIFNKINIYNLLRKNNFRVLTISENDSNRKALLLQSKFLKEPNLKMLECLTYELNILFNNKKNNYFRNLQYKFPLKSLFDYDNDNTLDSNNKIIYNSMNIFQTEDIIKNILNLKANNTFNKEINNFINYICVIDINKYSYTNSNISLNLFRRLYEVNEFKNKMNSNSIEENIENLKEDLKNVLGPISYEEFMKKLELLNRNFYSNTINNHYQISQIYSDVRNIIIKYINIRYS